MTDIEPQGACPDVSLDALSRRFQAVLLRYFVRRGIDAQDAPDLVQEVFARLAPEHRLGQLRAAEGYLFTIAANIANDHFRRRKARGGGMVAPVDGDALEYWIDEVSPERALASRQELACIVLALNEMPERMRNIFILARLESMSRAEIATRLGISKRLVEQQITLATACLADRRRRVS